MTFGGFAATIERVQSSAGCCIIVDAAPELARSRFATDLVPLRDRLAVWREVFGHAIINLDIQPADETPIRVHADMYLLPHVACASVATSPFHGERTSALVQDGRNDIGLVAVMEGTAVLSQRGREIELASGDAALLRNDECGVVCFPADARYVSIAIPEAILAPMVTSRDALSVGKVPANNPLLRLLTGYIGLLDADHELITAETRQFIASNIQDLVALSIGATREAAEIACGRGIRAARLHALKNDIVANLGQRGLSLDALAKRHEISPRYVRKLFESDGTTFSNFVLGQRIARARKMLMDPRYSHLKVSTLAYEAGFGDLSYFNRVFRRHYGVTPSEFRAVGRTTAADDTPTDRG